MMEAANGDTLETAIANYHRDGAALFRNMVPAEWIDRLAKASDQILDEHAGADLNRPGEGRFFASMFSWLTNAEYAAFIRDGDLGALAGRIMDATSVRFFYDQLLVKEPGTTKRTPWHQDLPYWPVSGDEILSIWIPLDSATPKNGVVTYVKGSHRWNAFFPAETWSEEQRLKRTGGKAEPDDAVYRDGPGGTRLADIDKHPERFEFLSWNVEPGDVIVHHPLVVHGAPGNLSANRRRRALTTRWFGSDARWDESHPHFMRRLLSAEIDFPYPDLKTGDRIDDPLFPVVWQAPNALPASSQIAGGQR